MTTSTTQARLNIGAQILNAAELLGFVLLREKCPEERSKLIAGVLQVLAPTVGGTEAYTALMETAADIRWKAERNIEAAGEAEGFEWAQQREDELRIAQRIGVKL